MRIFEMPLSNTVPKTPPPPFPGDAGFRKNHSMPVRSRSRVMDAERGKAAYSKGLFAEKMAMGRLEGTGYQILCDRYKTRYGEIDIVAQKDGVIVFVEVKIRTSIEEALYAVTARARRRIEQSALHFMSEMPEYDGFGMRFDVMAFAKDPSFGGNAKGGGILVEHLDNAWDAGS